MSTTAANPEISPYTIRTQPSPEWGAKHPPAPKRVLVTGAGGAIGIHVLAHILVKTNWKIIALDSFKNEHKGYFDRIANIRELIPEISQEEIDERLTVIVYDLRAPITKREIERIGEVDYIVNLASRSDVDASLEKRSDEPTGASAEFVRNNIEIMLNMLDYARVATPLKFIQFSTDEVYGPAPKESGGHKEWEPIVPSNPYSGSKAAQEAIATAWWRSFDVPLIITNTMNNFGEMQAPSKFPAKIQKKIESEEVIEIHASPEGEIGTRYYLHSRDAADAILFILENVEPQMHGAGEIDRPLRLNIVGSKQLSNQELVEVISKLMEKPAKCSIVNFHEGNPGHDLHYGLNGEALAELGWSPPEDFDARMKQTIDWQRAHPDWMK